MVGVLPGLAIKIWDPATTMWSRISAALTCRWDCPMTCCRPGLGAMPPQLAVSNCFGFLGIRGKILT